MSANTKLTYDYLQGGTQDRKLVLGTISCRLYGSNQSFDDRAAKLPLHQIKQSSDTKTGVTTISGFVQSDLTYFEPQVAWDDRTADKSASNWPVDNKGESLCVSIYCDGETKKPVVEYPILSHDFDAIDVEFTDGKTRQPFIFKERSRTVKHFVAKDAVLAKSGQTVDDLSSIVVVVGHCELSEVVDGISAPRNRAGSEWLGNSAKYQHDTLTHEVDLGEAEPLPPQERPIYHKRSLLRVKRVTPLVRFVFYYKSQDALTKLGIIPAPAAGNWSRDTGELPVLTAAEYLEKLAAVPAMYKGKDVKSFAETCRNASKAVTLLAVSFDDEDWQTFEVLRSKQASIEDFTKKWPSQTQLRTFLGQAQSPKEAENAYRALVILTERLIKLKNTPLSTAQQNYRSFYGQFKLTGQGLQTSSFEALKELNVGALTVNTSANKTSGKRRTSTSKASVAKKGKSTETPSSRHAISGNMANDSSDDSLVVKASLLSAKPKSARGSPSTKTAAAAASMKRVSSHVQAGQRQQHQNGNKGKESQQKMPSRYVQAPAFAQANGAPPTPAASTSGSQVRDASPETSSRKSWISPMKYLTHLLPWLCLLLSAGGNSSRKSWMSLYKLDLSLMSR